MKKLYLLFCLLPCIALAQKYDTSNTKVGFNAGATFSGLRYDDNDVNSKYGFNFLIGASFELPLSERLSFLSNINYERKSSKAEFRIGQNHSGENPSNGNDFLELKPTLHYISIPLNLKYYIGVKKNFYINAGPYFSFLIEDKLKTNQDAGFNYSTNYESTDFGVNLGIGTTLSLSQKQNLNIEIRHNYGLKNINNSANNTLKTNAFNLILNWDFQL